MNALGKFERTWVTIDQQAFDHNLSCLHQIIPSHVKISLVVKANAYGHGLAEIGHMAERNEHVYMLCTASLTEALELRTYGIKKPILVLGIIDHDPVEAVEHDIELLVYDTIILDSIHEAALRLGKKAVIHIKVDTGLSRLGIFVHQARSFILYAQQLPCIELRGICSHFAKAASEDQTFTQLQYRRFNELLDELIACGINIPLKHMTNTAASTVYDLDNFNMIRIGAGAYGLMPSQAHYERTIERHPDYNLEPVLSWHTRIYHIKKLPKDTPVGYDCTFLTSRDTTIALLPIGYSDGYDKRLSNKSFVYLPKFDRYAPVIGRVAMNMTTIDVTGFEGIELGDEVILVGKQPEIKATRLAELTGSHNAREITLSIRTSIERVINDCQLSACDCLPWHKTNSKLTTDQL